MKKTYSINGYDYTKLNDLFADSEIDVDDMFRDWIDENGIERDDECDYYFNGNFWAYAYAVFYHDFIDELGNDIDTLTEMGIEVKRA